MILYSIIACPPHGGQRKGDPVMADTQGLLSAARAEAYERLPVPLCILRADGGTPRLLLVSDGICALLNRDRASLGAEFAADPLAALAPEDRAAAQETLRCEKPREKFCRVCGVTLRCQTRSESAPDGTCLYFISFQSGEQSESAHIAQKRDAGLYERELSYLRQSVEYNLIAKGHYDLTENRILEYTPLSGNAFAVEGYADYDAACADFVRMPVSENERAQLRSLLDRETLLRRCHEAETHFSLQYRREKDGETPLWVNTVVNTFVIPSNGHVECFIYSYDVTEKVLETQIISRLTLLGYDLLGLVYVRTGACRYFRIKKMRDGPLFDHFEDYNASIEEDIDRIIVPEQRESVRASLRLENLVAELEKAELFPFAYSMYNKEGAVLQKLMQYSYLDENRDTIFFCKSDVTKQYEAEHAQIDKLNAAMLEAEHANVAKSMFLSSMSHDLRTPLNGIIGFTDLAIRETDTGKKQDYLGKIKSSGALLLDLVNDTLELSRIESGKYVLDPEPVVSRELAGTVVTALRPSAELKGVSLLADPSQFPADTVWADRLKLQKIYLNLVSNAIKYTPVGGTVCVSVHRLEPPVDGNNRRIIVEDNGIGISEEFLPKLFEPFSQEHRPEAAHVAGTGLGLSIVKRIVDLMGGTIRVRSAVGVGTRFEVDLPLKLVQKMGQAQKTDAAQSESLAGKTILLCEDNYLNTEIATILLTEKGLVVDAAQNGREGLEKFSASAPGKYAAILMDIRMPVMDGYEATRALRALDRADAARVPVIAMTGDAFEEDIRQAHEAGMDDHLTKPIDPDRLFAVLREHIK